MPKSHATNALALKIEVTKAIAQNLLMNIGAVRRYAARNHSTGMDGNEEQAKKLFAFYQAMAPVVGASILELGPGKTLETLKLAKEEGGAQHTAAADVTRYHSDERARSFGVEYFVFDGAHLPVDSSKYDLVWACYCMQHFRKPEQMLREIHRVLRPAGKLVCRVDLRDHYHMFVPGREFDCLRHSERLWNLIASNRISWVNRLRVSHWNALFERCGFTCERLDLHESDTIFASNRPHDYLAHLDDRDVRTYRFDAVLRA